MSYTDAGSGEELAEFEYGPFGQIVLESGSHANDLLFRFSTKRQESESGLLYFGYRYFSTDAGRWFNRDPIGENAGPNNYYFIGNDSVGGIDVLGLFRYETTYTDNEYLGERLLGKIQGWIYHSAQTIEGGRGSYDFGGTSYQSVNGPNRPQNPYAPGIRPNAVRPSVSVGSGAKGRCVIPMCFCTCQLVNIKVYGRSWVRLFTERTYGRFQDGRESLINIRQGEDFMHEKRYQTLPEVIRFTSFGIGKLPELTTAATCEFSCVSKCGGNGNYNIWKFGQGMPPFDWSQPQLNWAPTPITAPEYRPARN